jgi:hypothetical protein
MRTTRLTRRLTATTAVGAALAAALVVTPARAGDDGVPFDTQILRNIMGGLGLQRGDEPQIDYHERGPLVLPPGKDLPPPQADASVVANPAWPKDPDIARAKAEAEFERTRNVEAEIDLEQNQHMRPDQMVPGARTNRAALRPAARKTSSTGERRMSPNELGYKGDMFSLKNMFGSTDARDIPHFTGEPERAALTDPPPGYRVPSPAQPYRQGKEKYLPKATDYYSNKGVVDSSTQ